MALPNSEQITSQIAILPDAALKQMAMMHKSDPYILPLIISEDGRRKQMRRAAQAQMGAMPQPKVVDAALAQMGQLPEEQGIAQLPAPNMQRMADGGIAGYGDEEEQRMAMGGMGGEFDFAQRSEPVLRMSGGGMAGYAGGGAVQRFGGLSDSLVRSTTGDSLIDQMQAQGVAALRPLQDQIKQAEQMYVAAAKSGDPAAISRYGKVLSDLKAQLVEKTNTQFGNAAPAVMAQLNPAAAAPAVAIPSANPPAAPPAPPAPTGKVPPALSNRPPPVAGPRPASAAPRAPVVLDGDYLTQLDAMKARAGDVVDPTALLQQNQTTKEVNAEKAALAERKLEQKAEFDEMFKGKEARISKRESELEKSKDTNTRMAFLEAGLAVLQARGPGLASIAQGAGVGLKQYQSGLKDIRAAQEKLDDARDRVEELRQNQSSMNKSEVRNAEKGIRAIVNQGDRDLIKGVQTAIGVQREDFRAAVTSNIAVAQAKETRDFQAEQGGLDRRSRERINSATIEAAAKGPERMAFNAALQSTITKDKPGGDPVAAYQKLMEMKREPMTVEKMRAEWLDPMKRQQISTDYPNVKTFEDYMLVMGAGGGGGAGGDFKLVGVK